MGMKTRWEGRKSRRGASNNLNHREVETEGPSPAGPSPSYKKSLKVMEGRTKKSKERGDRYRNTTKVLSNPAEHRRCTTHSHVPGGLKKKRKRGGRAIVKEKKCI